MGVFSPQVFFPLGKGKTRKTLPANCHDYHWSPFWDARSHCQQVNSGHGLRVCIPRASEDSALYVGWSQTRMVKRERTKILCDIETPAFESKFTSSPSRQQYQGTASSTARCCDPPEVTVPLCSSAETTVMFPPRLSHAIPCENTQGDRKLTQHLSLKIKIS